MKIGIDTLGCDHGRSGLGSFFRSFAANIPYSDEYQFDLFGSEIDKFVYTAGRNLHYESIQVTDNKKDIRRWHKSKFNKFVKNQKYDAVIFPLIENSFLIKSKVPVIIIVNTVFSSLIKNKSYKEKRLLKKTLKNATKIIAASRFIKYDLICNGLEDEKIALIYNGIDHKLLYPQIETNPELTTIKPFAIKKPYFVYGSRLTSPEKKHIELVKAFELFKKRTNLPHRLVIAGSENEYSEKIYKEIISCAYARDIFLTGYFPHESLPQLYANSEGCIFPSVDEGVGLPVLEAMATGIPVACTDSAALSEIKPNAYLKIVPDNTDSFAEQIARLAQDEELRKRLIETGLEWSNMFSWETSVNQTIELISTLKYKK